MEYPAPPPDEFSAYKDDPSQLAAIYARFSPDSQRILSYAREEAQRLGEHYLSTEHLLLGMVRENDTDAARLLDRLGVSLGRIRSEIERQVARGDRRQAPVNLTPRAFRVLLLACDELGSAPEQLLTPLHLLFGLVGEGEGLAARVLRKLGVSTETLRYAMALPDSQGSATGLTPLQNLGSNARRAVAYARQDARDSEAILPGHLLLGLLHEPENEACQVLQHLGVDCQALMRYVSVALADDLPAEGNPHLSADTIAVFERAFREAQALGTEFIGTDHVLLGILSDTSTAIVNAMQNSRIEIDRVREAIRVLRKAPTVGGTTSADDPMGSSLGWQSWSEGARNVIAQAREEAARLGENYVSTEHLLLGIVRDEDSLAIQMLATLGVSAQRVRSEVERQIARGDGRLGQNMQLTPRAKRVIDLAFLEKLRLRDSALTEWHLLLGLIREGEGLAGRILNKLGVTLERACKSMTASSDDVGEGKPMWQRFTERARRVVFFAQEEAGRNSENMVNTEHLLLGIVRESDNVAAKILDQMGISLEGIRTAVMREMVQGSAKLGTDMQLTPRAKRVIDLSYDEARQLKNNYIGTEHLLLGLVREAEGLGGRVLLAYGVDLERTRQEVIQFQDTAQKEKVATENSALKAALELLPVELREKLNAMLSRRATGQPERLYPYDDGEPHIGDLGIARPWAERTHIEMVLDIAAFTRLDAIFQAKDTHGYRAMAESDQVKFLLPALTPLRMLVPPVGNEFEATKRGLYVRVLDGKYEGYAGWILRRGFERIGPDNSDFPPADPPTTDAGTEA